MGINKTRWFMHHFDADPIEQESIRITAEVLKTLVVVVLAAFVLYIV